MIETVKKNKINIITIIVYGVVFLYNKDLFYRGLSNSWGFIREMIEILPAVMIISGLIAVWVPKEMIVNNFGQDSGLKGKLISVFIGSVSAGPIYAAFPFAQTLLTKGASIGNIVIIISSWAVMKIPMLIVEVKFLGLPFAASRYILTMPGIIFLGYLVNKLVHREDVLKKTELNLNEIIRIEEILPGYNCGACGYKNCREYAAAIYNKNAENDLCQPGDSQVVKELKGIQL
ncbi:MAG TPA: permease [Clostridia bacterium]|nr:permease [Clostridia bacterium]